MKEVWSWKIFYFLPPPAPLFRYTGIEDGKEKQGRCFWRHDAISWRERCTCEIFRNTERRDGPANRVHRVWRVPHNARRGRNKIPLKLIRILGHVCNESRRSAGSRRGSKPVEISRDKPWLFSFSLSPSLSPSFRSDRLPSSLSRVYTGKKEWPFSRDIYIGLVKSGDRSGNNRMTGRFVQAFATSCLCVPPLRRTDNADIVRCERSLRPDGTIFRLSFSSAFSSSSSLLAPAFNTCIHAPTHVYKRKHTYGIEEWREREGEGEGESGQYSGIRVLPRVFAISIYVRIIWWFGFDRLKNDRISGITVSGTRTTTRPPSPKTVLRSVSESTLEESTKIHTKDSIYRTGSIGIDRRINSFSDLDVIEGLLFAIRNNSRSSYYICSIRSKFGEYLREFSFPLSFEEGRIYSQYIRLTPSLRNGCVILRDITSV